MRLRLATNHRLTVTDGQPLLAYLLNALGLRRGAIKNLLKCGAVTVNHLIIRQFDHPLLPGDEVNVCNLRAAVAVGRLQQARIQTVYEDDALIVVDKPSGLLTVATHREHADTLNHRVNEFLRGRNAAQPGRALVVHRIDRETSGLVLFAKSEHVKHLLQDAWPTVEKIYYAVVRGRPAADQGTVTSYLTEDSKSLKVFDSDHPTAQSRLAISQYRILKNAGNRSLVEVRLETGRKHQIRVHLASLGCCVIGDRRYGKKSDSHHRLALHAGGLLLAHPLTGQRLSLTSQLPKGLRAMLA